MIENKSTKPDDSDVLRILKNSRDLLTEAQLLFKHGHRRRAGFLAITSIEELAKAMAFQETQENRPLRHKEKFKMFSETIEREFAELIESNFTDLAGEKGKDFSEEQKNMVNKLWRETMIDLKNTFHLDRLRQFLLYEDLTPPKEVLRFKDSIHNSLSAFMINAAHKIQTAIKTNRFPTQSSELK